MDIDSYILHRAEQIVRSENIPGGTQDRSISGKGERATWCGAVGQAIFERAMEECGVPFSITSVKEQDYLVPAGRLEVKTKERAVAPRPDYEASVYEYNQAWQQPDWLGFVSLKFASGYDKTSEPSLEKYEAGFVVGCIEHERFMAKAFAVKKGDALPYGQPAGYPTLNIEHRELESIERLGRES